MSISLQATTRMATLRQPQPSEAALLTELALAAKAYWGYSAAFMASARAELAITASDISQNANYMRVAVLPGKEGPESQEEIVAVCRITLIDDAEAELSYLWVSPAHMGRGLGRLLWEDAVRRAGDSGVGRLTLDADPHAESFHIRMGAQRCGEVPSGSVPGRVLPRLVVDVPRALATMQARQAMNAAA
ncbi:acetyltransferase [Cordyceps fumosorosea ARSEF 2679]|uniref:Acetyltransferase n=1 Tax=Cordyceps fumosorosea (strain ARSEF 2679) TaxID=1081104 RepID=A0A167XCW4_CORFA|nr:acetyltransferase [Cordyceps fumosorosea ARSEF 2679]OAA64819.1 acetyltransferase [Cordyceps fumosorosea ARSEF 2679]